MESLKLSDSNTEVFKEEYLKVREHMDPDRHWIGETLPAPSEGEVQYAGVETAVGASPFPARADHSHDLRTRQTYLTATKSAPASSAVYIDTLATAAGWEDFLHAGSTQLIDFPLEGVWIVNARMGITRSTGVFPATLAYTIRFNYNNATSIHVVEFGNLPEGRTNYTATITEIVAFGSIAASTNLQVWYQNSDTVAHTVVMYLILQRSASSIEAETE